MDDEHGPIPEDLEAVVDLLNTIDLEDGTDQLANQGDVLGVAGRSDRRRPGPPGDGASAREGSDDSRRAACPRRVQQRRAPRRETRSRAVQRRSASCRSEFGSSPTGSALTAGGKGVERYLGEIVAELRAGTRTAPLATHQALRLPGLPVGVLGQLEERVATLVCDGSVRQPQQDARLSPPESGSRCGRGVKGGSLTARDPG